jgi:hypothetical protein
MSELDLLRVCKQAVDEGLIGKGDYDVVKVAFLRAQQIKAGLDAGFIRTEDYNKARDAYLNALDFNALIGAGAGSGSGPLPTGPLGGGAPAGNGSAPSGGSSALRAAVAAFENNGGPVPAPPTRGARVAGAGAGSGGATPAGSGSLSGGDGSGGGAAGARAGGGAGPRNSGAGDIAAIMADVPQYSKGATAGKFSMAGIAINEDCVNLFMHMKTRSAVRGARGGGDGAWRVAPVGLWRRPRVRGRALRACAQGTCVCARERGGACNGACGVPSCCCSGGSGRNAPRHRMPRRAPWTAGATRLLRTPWPQRSFVNIFPHRATPSLPPRPPQYKWVTFKVDDSGKTVVPDRVGGKNSAYEDFVAALPASDCRYGGAGRLHVLARAAPRRAARRGVPPGARRGKAWARGVA